MRGLPCIVGGPFAIAGLITAFATAQEPDTASAVRTWNLPADVRPDGLAVSWHGTAFVGNRKVTSDGLVRTEILEYAADGTISVRAVLPDTRSVFGGPASIDLAIAPAGGLVATHATLDTATRGVYRIGPRDTRPWRIPGSEDIAYPTALAFDTAGHLYVTDGVGGSIWRVPRGSDKAELWARSPLLDPVPELGSGFVLPGANGLAFRDPNELYVANSARGSIVEVTIDADGSAIAEKTLATRLDLMTVEGLAADPRGGLLAPVSGSWLLGTAPLLQIDTDSGMVSPLPMGTGDPSVLDNPRALVVEPSPAGGASVLAVNGGAGAAPAALVGLTLQPLPWQRDDPPQPVTLVMRDAQDDAIKSDGQGPFSSTIRAGEVEIDTGRRSLTFDFSNRIRCNPWPGIPCASPFAGTNDVGSSDHVSVLSPDIDGPLNSSGRVWMGFYFRMNNDEWRLLYRPDVIRRDTNDDMVNDQFELSGTECQLYIFIGTRRGFGGTGSPWAPVAVYSMPWGGTIDLQ